MPSRTFVRPADADDLKELAALIAQTIQTSYGGVYPPKAIDFFKGYHDREALIARMDNAVMMVAETEQGLVGTGSLKGDEILGVFVAPDRQGIGIGAALMDRLEGKARVHGLKEAVLSVSLPSRRFYERRGYKLGQPISRDLGDGQRLDFWKGRKAL